MIELPESRTWGLQADKQLAGRTITAVFNATQPHKFTWYSGDPLAYPALLVGRAFLSACGYGAFVDFCLDKDVHITVGDGTNVRYLEPGSDVPTNYQLLICLDNEAMLVFTVAMYGGIHAYAGVLESTYFQGAVTKPSPLDEAFDAAYFGGLFDEAKKNLSAKAFLATEQRIPGLGNGVVQDILFQARIHPKRKLASIAVEEREQLFHAVKTTLAEMTTRGGRDTEKDLFGNAGRYRTILSRNTYADPCPICGGGIVKEAYLGGAVYYCPCCQPLK